MKQSEAFAEAARRAACRKLFRSYKDIWKPGMTLGSGAYPWQEEFHNQGATEIERMLMAGNRVGKTSCAAAEVAIHLTGEYPPWWKGHRFTEPVRMWAGGETNETLRDIIQDQLLGPEDARGTGWIPGHLLMNKMKKRQAGVDNVIDQAYVIHKTGGISTISFKSYEQGVEKWRGARLDFVWLDEEPSMQIYVEAITRILDRKGRLIITFTPHLGATDVVQHFKEAKQGQRIWYKNVTWDDAPHLDEAAKEQLLASYPPHERETRSKGIPMMGAGAVFPISDDDITVSPFQIPDWWPRINGHDFGIAHPAAGAFLAIDRESDTVYLYDCYKASNQTPAYHAPAMKKHGDWIPIAWPRDGLQRDKGAGEQLKDQYRRHGAYMLPEHAAYRDERGEHVEPGLLELYEYMRTGRFKVFKGICEPFLEEKRMYHYAEEPPHALVKLKDDIISATRYAFVMRRHAKVFVRGGTYRPPMAPIVGRRA